MFNFLDRGILNLLIEPIKRFGNFTRLYQEGITGFERFMEVLEVEPDVQDSAGAIDLTRVQGKIEFKDVSFKRTVPFAVIVAIALGIALINVHPPLVLFGLFLVYGLSGYAVYVWRRMKGRPVSVIATQIDDPDEKGLHH